MPQRLAIPATPPASRSAAAEGRRATSDLARAAFMPGGQDCAAFVLYAAPSALLPTMKLCVPGGWVQNFSLKSGVSLDRSTPFAMSCV
eukprot:661383-Pleurochrysis_carterae.AAC.1